MEQSIFECMFDSEFAAASDEELVVAIEDGVRQEAIAGARRLAAIAELTRRRVDDDDERALWAFDPWDSVAAEVAAAMAIGSRRASGQMRIAEALRDHLPQVAALHCKGALSSRLVSTITWGTRLVQGDAGVGAHRRRDRRACYSLGTSLGGQAARRRGGPGGPL